MTSPSAIREAARAARNGDYDVQRRLSKAYGYALKDIAEAQTALVNEIVARQNAGLPVSKSWFNQNQRYLSLQSKYYGALREFGLSASTIVEKYIPERLGYLLEGTRGEIRSTGIEGPDYGGRAWSVINKEAIAAAQGILDHDKSPFRNIFLRDFPETGLAEFRKVWMRGVLLGQNPRRIASFAARRVAGLTLGRAQLMARTEFHRAYREGKLEQFARSNVVTGWVWRAALDKRTCGVCWSMHGSVHEKTEPMESHPSCRCVMIPQTDGPKSPRLEDGESAFSRLPADEQLRILGPSRFKMHQSGTPLASMIGTRHSPLWGTIRSFEPLGRTPRVIRKPGPPDDDLYANPFRTPAMQTKPDYSDLGQFSTMSDEWGASWGAGSKLGMTDDMYAGLRTYQGSSYSQINRELRGQFGQTASMLTNKVTGQIDKAMDISRLPQAAVVYRGTTFSTFNGAGTYEEVRAMIGQTITDKGYFSTATFNPFAKPVMLEVTVPKGTRAVWMSGENTGSGKGAMGNAENELLLDRGTKFVIDSVEKRTVTDYAGRVKDGVHVKVRVVGQET